MATSPEKVAAAIEQAVSQLPELQRQAAGMPAVALAAVSTFVPTLTRMAQENVPADPVQLDALLDGAAAYVLSLKSDAPADADATAEDAAPELGEAA